MYIQVYNCFRREEQLEQPKEAAVPESPKANDPEDRKLLHRVVYSYSPLVGDYKKPLQEPVLSEEQDMISISKDCMHGASNYTKVGICVSGVVGAAKRQGHYQTEMAGICCFVSYSYNT